MRFSKWIILSALLLASCSHHHLPETQLVREIRIDRSTFLVSFTGKDEEMVHQQALARAAEITEQNGYRHFVLMESKAVTQEAFRWHGQDALNLRTYPAYEYIFKCEK